MRFEIVDLDADLPVALEFAGACRPVLRYRLQQWISCRLAAERQALGRHLAEARYGATLH
jgi:hypothetical protein